MRLANLRDEDLKKIAMFKTRRGTATSEALRAQQILYTRNMTGGFYNDGYGSYPCTLDYNLERKYQTFKEVHGCTLEEYLNKERKG